RGEVLAIRGDAREARRPERHRGRRVRRDGRNAREQHRREREEASAACDRVQRAAERTDDEEEDADRNAGQRPSITTPTPLVLTSVPSATPPTERCGGIRTLRRDSSGTCRRRPRSC